MTLWIVLTLMTVAASVGLTIPLVRRYDARPGRAGGADLLKDQLRDIDAQVEAGGLPAVEAREQRIEVGRRILAEGASPDPRARPLGERSLMLLGLGLLAIVALAATVLYSKIGRPDLAGGAPPAAASDSAHPEADVAGMIGQLEAKMKQTPDDPQGWRMLGWSYMRTGRYGEAADAYGRASRLDPANGEYLSAQGEALTQAAGGEVTAAARTAFAAALSKDPRDPRARYFLAMVKDQRGDHAAALADWIALLKSAPAGAPWAPDVRAFVEGIAKEHNEDISGKLPPEPSPPGPNAGQAAAAQGLPAGNQQAMIQGMVERLAARLKANPRDADGWLRLMRARIVMGDATGARRAYGDALHAFADTPSQQAAFRAAARDMGVPRS